MSISDEKEVCERIIETRLYANMLAYLKLFVEALIDPVKRDCVQSQIWVLHNVVRMPECRSRAKYAFMTCQPQAVDALYKFCYATDYPVRLFFSLFDNKRITIFIARYSSKSETDMNSMFIIALAYIKTKQPQNFFLESYPT